MYGLKPHNAMENKEVNPSYFSDYKLKNFMLIVYGFVSRLPQCELYFSSLLSIEFSIFGAGGK